MIRRPTICRILMLCIFLNLSSIVASVHGESDYARITDVQAPENVAIGMNFTLSYTVQYRFNDSTKVWAELLAARGVRFSQEDTFEGAGEKTFVFELNAPVSSGILKYIPFFTSGPIGDGGGEDDAVYIQVVENKQKPIAAILVSPEEPSEEDVVWVDGSTSSDPDGGSITSCKWTIDGVEDENHENDLGPWMLLTPGETWLAPGTHTVSLIVWDDENEASERVTKTVYVKPSNPDIMITEFKVNLPPPVLSVTVSIFNADTYEPADVPVKIQLTGDISEYLDISSNVRSDEGRFVVVTSTGDTGTVTIPLGVVSLSKLSSSGGLSSLTGKAELYVSKLGFEMVDSIDGYRSEPFVIEHIAKVKSVEGSAWVGRGNQVGTKIGSGATLKPGDKLTLGQSMGVHSVVLEYIDGSVVKVELPEVRDVLYAEFFIGRTKDISDLPPSHNTQQLMWLGKKALIGGAKAIFRKVVGRSSFIISPLADPEALGQGLVLVRLKSAVLVEGLDGDSFLVSSLEGSPEVVFDRGEDSFELDAGMMTLLSEGQPPTAPTSFDLEVALGELGDLSELGILPVEGTLMASLVDVEAPFEAYVGESLNVELTVDYEFTESTEVSPGIWDVVAEEWLGETSEVLEGKGSRSYDFDLTAPSEEMDWALEASVFYKSEGKWVHDEADWAESLVIQVIELDENGGGIPGFPYEAIIFGLLLGFSFLSRRAALQS